MRWDDELVGQRIDAIRLDLGHRVGELSGASVHSWRWYSRSQATQLLLLDEPVASLDPLAVGVPAIAHAAVAGEA